MANIATFLLIFSLNSWQPKAKKDFFTTFCCVKYPGFTPPYNLWILGAKLLPYIILGYLAKENISYLTYYLFSMPYQYSDKKRSNTIYNKLHNKTNKFLSKMIT